MYFRGHEREMVKPFFRHATSEIGHDQLALNDMIALGEDVSDIPQGQPLPATTALLAYPFYQIGYHGHMGYLGYLYFLEFTPTTMGAGLLQALESIGAGVPLMMPKAWAMWARGCQPVGTSNRSPRIRFMSTNRSSA